MSDVLRSRAPLPLIPPAPFSHNGRRGSLGVLMAETGDGTQGLAKKSTPVRVLPRNMARITEMPAPQGLPRAQGGLEPACAAVVRGGSTSMRTAINAQSPSAPRLARDSGNIAVLTKIGLVGQGCTRHRKQTPCAPSLRVLRVSVCIRPAHAERGGAESARRSCKVCQTGLHPSLETSASRATSRRRRGGHGMPCPHTRRWKWAPRATRQTRTRVNVFENCYKFSISISPTANAV